MFYLNMCLQSNSDVLIYVEEDEGQKGSFQDLFDILTNWKG